MQKFILAGIAAVVLFATAADTRANVTTSEKILLQATMQQSIAEQLIDGKFYYFNRKTGKIQVLFPAKPHPLILSIGEQFIVCADFRDPTGKSVNVDFFVARQGKGFVIFDTVIDDHDSITRMMETGEVAVVR